MERELRKAMALLRIFARNRRPEPKPSPYVRMARALVGR